MTNQNNPAATIGPSNIVSSPGARAVCITAPVRVSDPNVRPAMKPAPIATATRIMTGVLNTSTVNAAAIPASKAVRRPATFGSSPEDGGA